MDIQEIRRARLATLIRERFENQADFVARTGENQGEVSALLKTKSFGEKKARKIEQKCGLQPGWLDTLYDGDDELAPAAPLPKGIEPAGTLVREAADDLENMRWAVMVELLNAVKHASKDELLVIKASANAVLVRVNAGRPAVRKR